MPDRIDTPFTGEHFAAYCERMIGQPYWYGTCAYKCTSGLLKSKKNQYPDKYLQKNESRYQEAIQKKMVASDCIGGVKGYAWTGGGLTVDAAIGTDEKIQSKYGSNGCPDKGANGMFEWAKSKGCRWGKIDTLPEVKGIALYKQGHAGYYIGNGWAVEWRGAAYGCVKTQVKERDWTHWYEIPFMDYGESDWNQRETILKRVLRKGCSGEDVKALQNALITLGYDLGNTGADGKFGKATEAAVKAFQQKNDLVVDGICGEKTFAALANTKNKRSVIRIMDETGIRWGNGEGYAEKRKAAPGEQLEWIVQAPNHWLAVVDEGHVCWVDSEKAIKL